MRKLFTSESVTEGHPDKVCDQVSDGILDAIIAQDPFARVACETAVTTGLVLVMGEISCDCYIDIQSTVRKIVTDIGYTSSAASFDGNACSVLTAIDEQSKDIALGVDRSLEHKTSGQEDANLIGAGDQGMVFGYACDQTDELMPLPLTLSHKLTRQLASVRKSARLPFLLPDGKAQVTVLYDEDGRPVGIPAIVVSSQHTAEVAIETLREAIIEEVIKPVIPSDLILPDTKLYVNPTGRFVIGGPTGDSGLTGRKIIVDTYGGYARHGGGAFSGKDPTKVDRSAAYFARYVAKHVVAAGLAKACEIEVAYAIGVATPVSVLVETFGTGVVSDEKIAALILDTFDFRPSKIIEALDLRRPLYSQVASYGHFGRNDLALPWEQLDKIDFMKA